MDRTTGAVFRRETWSKEAQLARENNNVARSVTDLQYEDDAYRAKTVHIPTVANLTATTITDGSEISQSTPTEVEKTIQLDQYVGVNVPVYDSLKLSATYDFASIYGSKIGEALSRSIDAYVFGLHAQAASGSSALAAITYDSVVDGVVALMGANVPKGDMALVVNAVGYGDLLKEAEFVRYDATGTKSPSASGEPVGSVFGVKVYVSENIVTDTTDKNFLMHKSAIALCVQRMPEIEEDRQPSFKRTLVTGSTLFGATVVRPDHLYILNRTP